MEELRCIMCGFPVTQEEVDNQKVIFTATAIGKRMILCNRDYKRILNLFEKGELHARDTEK